MTTANDAMMPDILEGRFFPELRDFILREFAAQRERIILWVPVLIGLGISLYFSLKFEPPPIVGAAVFLTGGILWLLARRGRGAGFYAAALILGMLTLAAGGFCSAQMRTMLVKSPVLDRATGPVTVEGRIAGIDRLGGDEGTRLILDELVIERVDPAQTPLRIRLKVRKGDGLQVGARIRVLAGLNPPSAPVEPGSFDFQRYAWFSRIGAFGFSYREPETIAATPPDGLLQTIDALRQTVRQKVEAVVPYPAAGVAIALLTGEMGAVPETENEAMRVSGMSHMLSISGMHVGMIASAIFFVSRLLMAAIPALALTRPIKNYAAALALIGAFSYMAFAGFSPPALRAMLMTGIVLLAMMLGRVPFSLRLVAVSASVILLILPDALMGASFQLSFAAVTGLIFFYERMRGKLSVWYGEAGWFRRGLLYLFGVCATSVIATLATGPFILYHFQSFSIYSVPANMIGVPLLGFIVMPAALISFALMAMGWEGPGLMVMGAGIDGILAVARAVTELPYPAWTPAAFPASAFMGMTAAALFFVLWEGKGRMLCLIPLAMACVILAQYRAPDILVSSTGKLVALQDSQGQIWFSERRKESFTAEIWSRRAGDDPESRKIWKDHPGIRCDREGCRTLWNGRRVAISRHAAGQAEDCAWADVMISLEPLRTADCRADTVVDFFDLWRNGAYALWPDGTVKSVASVRGDRPWSVSNRR